MDCEKYEPLLLDELYEELDELTSAAVKRHVSGCARCSGILQGLRATRRAAVLPTIEPPADLEERILAAAREAQKVVPIRGRVSQLVSRAGAWAMRPQTAMAAVFLLMIGSSAFLLRSNRPSQSAVSVTVAGEPSPALEEGPATGTDTLTQPAAAAAHGAAAPKPVATVAPPPAMAETALAARSAKKDEAPGSLGFASAEEAARSKSAADDLEDPFSAGQAAYRARRFDEATRLFDAAAANGNLDAALQAAVSTRDGKGCGVALGRFDTLAHRAPGTWQGTQAQLEAARCEMALGQLDPARDRLNKLTTVASHSAEAKRELEQLDMIAERRARAGVAGGTAGGAAAAQKAAPRAAAPAPAQPPPATAPAKPAATATSEAH